MSSGFCDVDRVAAPRPKRTAGTRPSIAYGHLIPSQLEGSRETVRKPRMNAVAGLPLIGRERQAAVATMG